MNLFKTFLPCNFFDRVLTLTQRAFSFNELDLERVDMITEKTDRVVGKFFNQKIFQGFFFNRPFFYKAVTLRSLALKNFAPKMTVLAAAADFNPIGVVVEAKKETGTVGQAKYKGYIGVLQRIQNNICANNQKN
jgi:hypothetical protein